MTVEPTRCLEERGARTALIATRGFADLLEIGRQERPEPLPAVRAEAEAARSRPELRFEARRARSGPTASSSRSGEDEPARLAALIARVRRRVGRHLPALLLPRSHPRAPTRRAPASGARRQCTSPASHEVLPRFREYERCSTTTIDAYLSPLLGRLPGPASAGRGVAAGLPRPLVMQSTRRRRLDRGGEHRWRLERALGTGGRRESEPASWPG